MVGAAFSTVDQSDIRGSSLWLAVMVMIRRELPRTRIVGQVVDLPHRTIEDSPFREPPRPSPTLLQERFSFS